MTVEQQLKLREYLDNSVRPTKEMSSLIIDGKRIGGYNSYTFFREKTYAKEPSRSLGGVIDNLNSYTTFLTPKVKIKFNLLSIDGYRTFMRLIEQKNEFTVTCYDFVYDKDVTYKMYFVPQDYPELYTLDARALGVIGYEVELIGTNASLDNVYVVYHSNPPTGASDTTLGYVDVPYGMDIIIGNDISKTSYTGYVFSHWSTSSTSGATGEIVFKDGSSYIINKDMATNGTLTLYAHYTSSSTRTLSFDYGIATKISGQPDSKEVTYGNAIGDLPTYTTPTVRFYSFSYRPYSNPQWLYLTKKTTGATIITSETIYNISGNATAHLLYDINSYTITYNSNGGSACASITGEYNSSISTPTPTKDGYTFGGWYIDSELTTQFNQSTMPPVNTNLYAKWE